MYEINITKISHNSINKFISYFKNKFIETFSNTGLYYEKEIKDEYIKNSNIFKRNYL